MPMVKPGIPPTGKETIVIDYDMSTTSRMPVKPLKARWLTMVGFSELVCEKSDLRLELARFNLGVGGAKEGAVNVDQFGMATDSWWIIKCTGLPDRSLRLFRGAHSMTELLRRYGFMDASGCINHKRVLLTYSTGSCRTPSLELTVPLKLQDATGVPQFFERSGICWFNAMCWTSFANPRLCSLICSYLPPKRISELAHTCLFNREDALALRNKLWAYSIGDDINDNPENDGKNGFSEFTLLCAKFKIPILRLKEENGVLVLMDKIVEDHADDECVVTTPTSPLDGNHIVVMRFNESDHTKFPIYREISLFNEKYQLRAMYLGQSLCGHQIGAAATTDNEDGCDWGVADADMHKDGIGPTFFRFDSTSIEKGNWWQVWKHVIHVTKFGRNNAEMCNHSPHNPGNTKKASAGNNSVDAIYTRCSLA